MTAPSAPSPAAAAAARTFAMHRGALMDLYAELPGDQGTFSAWEGGMSFIGLADHLAGSGARMLSLLRGEAPAPVEPSPDLPAAREKLRRTTEETVAALNALTDEDFSRRVPAFGGREMPVRALVDFLVQHEAHHKGQVWMMARMIGLKPPMFVKLG